MTSEIAHRGKRRLWCPAKGLHDVSDVERTAIESWSSGRDGSRIENRDRIFTIGFTPKNAADFLVLFHLIRRLRRERLHHIGMNVDAGLPIRMLQFEGSGQAWISV